MNTRKGLGHNCSWCHLSLSSNLTRSPSNYINHPHRHSAIGVGLLVFCLVLFCFIQCITSYKFHLQFRDLSSSLNLVIYLIDPRVDQERARGFPHLRTQGVILKFAANINTEQQQQAEPFLVDFISLSGAQWASHLTPEDKVNEMRGNI